MINSLLIAFQSWHSQIPCVQRERLMRPFNPGGEGFCDKDLDVPRASVPGAIWDVSPATLKESHPNLAPFQIWLLALI